VARVEEGGSLSEILERLGFGTRFGEGCLGLSFSSPFSHLERFREGVEDPARVGSIGISGLSVVGWGADKGGVDEPYGIKLTVDHIFLTFFLKSIMFSAVARRGILSRAPAWRTPSSSLRQRWASTTVSSNLNSVTEEDLSHFSSFLVPSSILSTLSPSNTPADELTPFNDDWMGKYKGKSTTVLRPRTTEEVSKIVKYCNEKRIGIVPQGGNTGLVGGSVPVRDELILSLSNLNKIRSFDPVSGKATSCPTPPSRVLTRQLGILVADAGCILQSLIDYLSPHNHIMPIDLGAKGRCAFFLTRVRRGRLNYPCLVAT